MPIMFNSLLCEAGLSLREIRLLRHADPSARKGRSPFELWRDKRPAFDLYQAVQSIANRPQFGQANHWASFGATVSGDTVFLGLYHVRFKGQLEKDTPKSHTEGVDQAGTCHEYELTLVDALSDCAGKLYVDWGLGTRAWIQRADTQNKAVIELRRGLRDPDFPGYDEFIQPLSRIDALPRGWQEALRYARGGAHEAYIS